MRLDEVRCRFCKWEEMDLLYIDDCNKMDVIKIKEMCSRCIEE